MQHFKFPSIEQFRTAVKLVRDNCKFHNVPLPKITFDGTVKIHGTNAAVVQDLRTNEIWAQSRENCITILSDNAGFAVFTEKSRGVFASMFAKIRNIAQSDATHIAIYGEWCGQGIQKGVAVSQLSKRFVVFAIKIIVDGGDEPAYKWVNAEQFAELVGGYDDAGIHHSQQFQTYQVTVDFANPELAQNEFVRITEAIEQECPVGKYFGVSGIGEGAVWTSQQVGTVPALRFKTKGEKHSDTKVTKIVEVDVEKVANIRAFADAVVTDHRCEKMLDKLIELGKTLDAINTGEFIKLINQDVIKEETDRLVASGFTWKEVAGSVTTNARQWWTTRLNQEAFK